MSESLWESEQAPCRSDHGPSELDKLAEAHARLGEKHDLLKQRCRGLQAYGSQCSGAAHEMALQLGVYLAEVES